jgi:ATP-binding cassette subfamily G (WHITE) protein 2 (SNQ2)
MYGLAKSAGGFFTFFLLVYTGFLAMSGFFRWTGTICANYDVAARFACVVVTAMVLYSGYLVPVFAMKRWLFWFCKSKLQLTLLNADLINKTT